MRAARGSEFGAIPTSGLVFLGLTGLVLVTFFNSLANPFVIDDHFLISNDPRVRNGDYRALATKQYWPPPGGNDLYRPLVSLSLGANWAVSPTPFAFRIPNLLIYAGACFALYLLVRDVVRSELAGIVAAALFAVHPVHTGPLNCIIDRAELLAACFGLLGVWLTWVDLCRPTVPLDAISQPRRGARPGVPIAALACFAIAVFSKESALTLLGAILLLELFARHARLLPQLPRAWIASLTRCYFPLLLVAVAYILARTVVLGGLARDPASIKFVDNILVRPEIGLESGASTFLPRWATPIAIFGRAAVLLIWPTTLSWDYSYAAIESVKSLAEGRVWLGVAALAVSVVTLIWAWQKRSPIFVAVGFLLITYALVSNTFVLIGTLFGERFLFLPSAGWCMLIGILVARAWQWVTRNPNVRGRVAAGGFLALCIFGVIGYMRMTIERNRAYASDALLNATDLGTHPSSVRLLSAVSGNLREAGDLAAARRLAERAMTILPDPIRLTDSTPGNSTTRPAAHLDFQLTYPEPWRLAGLAAAQMGKVDDSLRILSEGFTRGLDREDAWIVACDAMRIRGNYRRAIELLTVYTASNPIAAEARNNLAWYLITAEPLALRDPARAATLSAEAVQLSPAVGAFVDTYVESLLASEKRAEARSELDRLLPGIPQEDPTLMKLKSKRDELSR